MQICELKDCTGCAACKNICPKQCIEMKENEIGHLYPKIDEEKCIKCERCKKICSNRKLYIKYKAEKVYASWSKNSIERRESTSGGIANVISRYILENKGIVYGSAMNDGVIRHIRISNLEELHKIQGTKYVESWIEKIYKQVQIDLEDNKIVLFIGTPCQCAGIRAYLGKEYKHLYVIDLICTGVPPQKLLWEHLNFERKKIEKIRFRDEIGTRLTVISDNKILYQNPVWKDYFLMGFSKHLYLRESCYNCQFSAQKRVSDITLGDFWGLGRKTTFSGDIKDGVSAVFINNLKGMELFDYIKKVIFAEKRELEEAIKGNPRYYSPSNRHKNSTVFKTLYKEKGFDGALKSSLKKERIKYKLFSIKYNMKQILYWKKRRRKN